MKMIKRSPISVAIALAIPMTSGSVLAQNSDGRLEEIIVTAAKRSQSVLDVPYNISALGGTQLKDAGVTDTNALIRMVPGLNTFDDGARGSGTRNNYTLRGLNAEGASNQDDNPKIAQATVSTYVGETPVFFPLKLVDLERVEVLRGPQGTLYGSGSVGGTIRFIPKVADYDAFSFDVTGQVSTTEESDDTGFDGHVTINAPLSENSAIRFTAGREHVAGFIDAAGRVEQTGSRLNPGSVVLANPDDILGSPVVPAAIVRDSNDADITHARANFRFSPTDLIDISLSYHYQETEANDRNEDNTRFGSGEEYVNYTAFGSEQDSEFNLISADIEVDLGFAILTSATGFTDIETTAVSGSSSGFLVQNLPAYYFGFPRLFSPILRNESRETLTQEVRLVSQSEGNLQWVAGAFYSDSDLDFSLVQDLPGINDYANAYFGLSPALNFTDTLARGSTQQSFKDKALFGELTYNISDAWQITGGARIFDQELTGNSGVPLPFASRTTEFFYYGSASNDFLLGGFVPTTNTSDGQIFKVNSSYRFNDSTLGFFTWAQGFRAGGANQLPETDPFGNNNTSFLRFDADDADSYEIGVKGSLSSDINYSTTLFYVDWANFQTTLSSPFGISFVDNVPGATSTGLEFEANGYLGQNTAFNFSYAWTDAVVSDPFQVALDDPSTTVKKGTRLPGSPEHSLFAGITHTQNLSSSSLVYQANLAYQGETFSSFGDFANVVTDNFIEFDSYTVWNASLKWEKDQYSVTLFGNNLTNERGSSLGVVEEFLGPRDQARGVITPRTIGLRFAWSYN